MYSNSEKVIHEVKEDYKTLEENTRNFAKRDINELLFQYLPPTTTIDELDKLAGNILDIISQQWDNFRKDNKLRI